MPGCIVSATTANFSSVEKRRLRATPVITSTFENVSDIGTCLGLFLGPLGYRPCPVKTGCTPRSYRAPSPQPMRRDVLFSGWLIHVLVLGAIAALAALTVMH